ncbi:hypothetical protein Tco_0601723 [Tanacetum coccineum]
MNREEMADDDFGESRVKHDFTPSFLQLSVVNLTLEILPNQLSKVDANVESLAEHLNIKFTILVCQLKLIEIGLLDLGECEPELLHVDFLHISSGKEGFVESSVLDDVKDDLVSIFFLSHTGINPYVCGTDLDSVSFGNQCLITYNLLNFLLTHDSA